MHRTSGASFRRAGLTAARFIISLLSLSFAVSHCAAKSLESARDDVNSQIRLGAEFFLNRTETQESVQKHFHIMREHGFTIARIFIIWHDVESKRDEWSSERDDWIYDAAAANGIKIAATLCAEDPPGWMRLTVFYHLRADMNNPEYRQRAAVYLEKVVSRYKDHPAQGAWLLMNEPNVRRSEYGRPMNPTPGELTRWLWDAYGAGARSVIFWLWHPRTENNEAGEWNMVSLAVHPSERARAAKAVAETLQRTDNHRAHRCGIPGRRKGADAWRIKNAVRPKT